ncbi:MAG: hypothetical protein Q7T82_04130 [Armatimonadota bacterium]|nr:hypothetical protein [Armatimonadota bacterium]
MDMAPDTSNIAAKRVQMETIKPLGDTAGQRLATQSSLEANGNVKRRRPMRDVRGKRVNPDESGPYDTDTESQPDSDDDRPTHGNDGETHLLDAMA